MCAAKLFYKYRCLKIPPHEVKTMEQYNQHLHGWIAEIFFFFFWYTINIWHEFDFITDAEKRERQIFILHSCFTVKTLFSLFIQFHCYSFYG